ncbi:DNA-binding transcriptional regulator, FadR family [Maridesulfovibrio ferrireducens]|uniref:DNA-binding transcriptional regulator, FadR family n=1 Tax=Maridesulfovibrio ferrireducens TaxID=246191 RepID=A0A1G9KL91_9BACT|nr:FadR/GntR family transcriptional regulator [Maridesulfovibrio ferrireducens]SDL50422.1 DNA-binding transcriptional regulator, FadR family [Maridesulfovibrio ferrireducens]
MDKKKLIKLSLPKQISSEIEMSIKNGSLNVGDKLPSEPELVKIFGVSRNTVREAIQSLIQAGVLESRQGDGTYVMSSGRFEANMVNRLYESMDEVNEVRLSLEKEIVKIAAARRTEKDLELISIALENRNLTKDSVSENCKWDMEFHLAIARASHNSIFYDIYNSFSTFIYKSVENKMNGKETIEGMLNQLHIDLYEAIYQKDAERAESIIVTILEN